MHIENEDSRSSFEGALCLDSSSFEASKKEMSMITAPEEAQAKLKYDAEATENNSSEESAMEKSSAEEKTADGESGVEADNSLEEPGEEADSRALSERRFKRLMHLLGRSQFYTNFLVNKMDAQRQKEKETLSKKPAKTKNQTSSQEEKENKHSSPRVMKQYSPEDKKEQLPESPSTPRTRSTRRSVLRNHNKEIETGQVKRSAPAENSNKRKKQRVEDYKIADIFSDKEMIEKSANEQNNNVDVSSVAERQPALLDGGVLRDYQLEGFEWLKILFSNGVNGILADEMGLGKTVQCISLICHLLEVDMRGPFLIIAPLSTLPNWIMEFKRFAPQIPVTMYHGNPKERDELRKHLVRRYTIKSIISYPVIITSYDMILIDSKYLSRIPWKYLIIDEGHRIKNMNCNLIKKLKAYNIPNRLLLTGTPIQNNLTELWSLLNFLLPDIFDDLEDFEALFDASDFQDESSEKILYREREQQVVSIMHQILSPFLLRRMKCDVKLDLPPKKELIVYAPLSDLQKQLYSATLDRSIASLMKPDESPPAEDTTEIKDKSRKCRKRSVNYKGLLNDRSLNEWLEALEEMEEIKNENYEEAHKKAEMKYFVNLKMQNRMMQLRKVVNHPYLIRWPLDEYQQYVVNEDIVRSSGKLRLLDQMLAQLKQRGHKVLIFSQMVQMIEVLHDFMLHRNYAFFRLDGNTPVSERIEKINQFNSGESEEWVFLISTRAGGLGINLTGADTVIIYDSDWNPQCDLQAQDRCHRIGQKNPVMVYRLVTKDTIDERMVVRARAKRRLEKLIIQKGRFKESCWKDQQDSVNVSIDIQDLRNLLLSCDHSGSLEVDQDILTKKQMDALLDRSDKASEIENVFEVIKEDN